MAYLDASGTRVHYRLDGPADAPVVMLSNSLRLVREIDRAKVMRKTLALVIVAALLPMAASALAQAPAYPDKPIRIIVPFPAGGVADTFGREIGKKLTEAWGQPVLI